MSIRPMLWNTGTGTVLGTGAAARQEWDGSSWGCQWEGMRVVCGLTDAFPATGV